MKVGTRKDTEKEGTGCQDQSEGSKIEIAVLECSPSDVDDPRADDDRHEQVDEHHDRTVEEFGQPTYLQGPQHFQQRLKRLVVQDIVEKKQGLTKVEDGIRFVERLQSV